MDFHTTALEVTLLEVSDCPLPHALSADANLHTDGHSPTAEGTEVWELVTPTAVTEVLWGLHTLRHFKVVNQGCKDSLAGNMYCARVRTCVWTPSSHVKSWACQAD